MTVTRRRKIWRRLVTSALSAAMVGVAVTGPVVESQAESGNVVVAELSVNHLAEPLGIPVEAPVFSWQLRTGERGVVQSARQIQIATSSDGFGAPDVWDSGRIESDESVDVPYTGDDLDARTRYYWRVRVWDGNGSASPWSEPDWFETALPDDATGADAWEADWIGAPPSEPRGIGWSDYTITVRTSSIKDALGIVFYADSAAARNTYMWQLSARGEPSLRPHSRVDGAWAEIGATPIPAEVVPGGLAAEQEITIDLADGVATTSINGHHIEAREIPLRSSGTLGFRTALGESGTVHEVLVTKGDETLFHTDFSDGENPFAIGAVNDGRLMVSGVVDNGVFRTHEAEQPLLRRDFTVDKPVASARMYSTALGVYRTEINGQRVGDHELAPGWTDYSKLVQYQVHDVTDLVRHGDNTVGAELSPGWYAGNLAWHGPRHYGTDPAFLGRLEITYDDGTTTVVTSDDSWTMTRGPVVNADLLMGETYDFGREVPGWSEPGAGSEWSPVHVFAPAVGELRAQTDPPVRVTEERSTESVTTPKAGVTIYDMGQNMVGWARVRLTGKPGDVVTIRHGEVLNPDGTLYTANLRTARATETVTLNRDGTTEYSPRFTFHGFRYIEITGLATPPAAEDVTGIVVGTDNEITSAFSTSDPMLNRLHSNIVWGVRGNFLSVPTDTPARDERLGYSGDLNVIVNTATFNHDAQAFLAKWLRDMRLRQNPNGILPMIAPGIDPGAGENVATAGWGDGHITVTHALWKKYGDTQVIADNWQAMVDYVSFWTSVAKDGIVPDGHAIGDWLNLDDPTPDTLLATAYYAHDARLLSEMARATGRDREADQYAALFETIRAAYADSFIASDGKIATGSQATYAMSLGMGLVPADDLEAVGGQFVAAIEARGWHLSTGFLGTPHLLPALTAIGRDDVAYQLLLEKQYPSWLYEITKGATTTWERWDSIRPDGSFQDPAMNSFNHYAYGAVGEWMYSSIGGIEARGPGYSTFDVAPRPGGGLTHAAVSHTSPYGQISSSWTRASDSLFTLDVSVPANTTAVIHVPAVSAHAVTEGGRSAGEALGVSFVRMEDGAALFEVGSGTYAFESDDVRGFVGTAADEAVALQDAATGLVESGAVDRTVENQVVAGVDHVVRATREGWRHYTAGNTRAAVEALANAQARTTRLRQLIERWTVAGSIAEAGAETLTAGLLRIDAALAGASTRLHGVTAALGVPSVELIPGSTVQIDAVLDNHGDVPVLDPAISLDLPSGWSATPAASAGPVAAGESAVLPLMVLVGDDQAITEGLVLTGAVTYRRGDATTTVPVEAVVDVVSPVEIVSVTADPPLLDLPGDATTVTVRLRNRRADAPLPGAVTFTAPSGWTVAPDSVPYQLAGGDEGAVSVTVTSPEDAEALVGVVDVAALYGEDGKAGDNAKVRISSALKSWTFETDGDTEGWAPWSQLDGFTVADGALTATSTGGDPHMAYGPLSLDVSAGAHAEITMSASTASEGQIFWGTANQPGLSESRSSRFSVNAGGPHVYLVEIPPQDSPLTLFRLDPLTEQGTIRIESIRLVR